MKYQLILQLPEEQFSDIDWIADLEERLDDSLFDAEVDGHDIGQGEVNVFILTNTPVDSFALAKNILQEEGVECGMFKAAYRDVTNERYIPLWPKDLKNFKIS